MISIIICSKNAVIDARLADNISRTIGTDYELVHIDNSQNQYNIFQAYNLGVKQAKGDYLCFMHEDVFFHSKDWGLVLLDFLSQKSIGLLGLAGSKVIIDQLDWRFYNFVELPTYVIQGNYSVEPSPVYYKEHNGDFKRRPLPGGKEQVAVIDGVWMAARKELFSSIRFDEDNFHAFHLYDSDLSMQVNRLGLDIIITDKIVLEHQSEGFFTSSFIDGLEVFLKKWESSLPVFKGISIDEDLSEKLAVAKKSLEIRLATDGRKIIIKELLQKKKTQACRDFTREELKIMDNSAFIARKGFIKDRSIPSREVRKAIRDYNNLSFSTHTIKLMMKYFWYRVLC